MKMYRKIPLCVSVHLRYLHQDLGIKGTDLVKRFPKYRRSAIYRHMLKEVGDVVVDKRKGNKGRPKVLTLRDERNILRQIPKLRRSMQGNFTLKDVRTGAGVREDVCDMTVSRVLHKEGYHLRRARRKGILTEKDVRIRLKFARHAKKALAQDIWSKEISFYLDGAGFAHKYNPCENARATKSMTWRKKNEGLALHCTAAGSHDGSGGRVAKFMVAIAYGKGVTMCNEFKVRLTGKSFADFVVKYFPPCFSNSANPVGKLFLQDGDPRQNSRVAMNALGEVGGRKFAIPARSPDLNPIENIFHIAKEKLKSEAIAQKITCESYEEFVKRVIRTLKATPIPVIDRTIASMNKRIDMVIKSKGERIKY